MSFTRWIISHEADKPCYNYFILHNKEISHFLNKLKAIITSGLRRFISSKEIFPPSQFYFSNAIILCKAQEHLIYIVLL